jgi:MOB kinase activator 1
LYAIIYTHHFATIESVAAVPHLNTSFKHFMFFILEFQLVKAEEFDALDSLVQELKERYYGDEVVGTV